MKRPDILVGYGLTAVLFLFILAGCGEGTPAQEEDDMDAPTEMLDEMEEDNPEQNEFLYTLPSPMQIASIFRRSGLTYYPGITNSIENVSKYNTKFSQKMNFGVYAADLAYSSLNDQNQDCIDYVKALSSLSESLWMTNVFSSVDILGRFERNLGNSDSLSYIIADFQMELDSYLDENGLSSNSLIIFAGAWTESMFIAFNSIQKEAKPELTSRLIEQKKIAKDLIEILEREEDDADVAILVEHLKQIHSHFVEYDIENAESVEDLSAMTMSDEQISAVLADITKARTFIVNG